MRIACMCAITILLLSTLFLFSSKIVPSYQQQKPEPSKLSHMREPRNTRTHQNVYNYSSSLLPCDKECLRFRRLLDNWPAEKPKAAVVMLLGPRSLKTFARFLNRFNSNFNNIYRYPVIVFYEQRHNRAYHQKLRSFTKKPSSLTYIQVVHLDIPSFVNRSALWIKPCCKMNRRYFSMGYRHMMRFHAITVYKQPILAGLQYVWRLDDDSHFIRRVKYDVFRLMRDRRMQYGYWRVMRDRKCIAGMWPDVSNYMKKHAITPKWQRTPDFVYFNNFEICDLNFILSSGYRDYAEYIDRLGGIYYHRWGDHTIKTIGVYMFVPQNRTHQFKDIAYKHLDTLIH